MTSQTTSQPVPGERILLRVVDSTVSLATHAEQIISEDCAALDAQPAPAYFIFDIRELNLGLDDLMSGISLSSKNKRFIGHPNMAELLIVTESPFYRLAAKGMSHPIFGGQKVSAFYSVEEAIAYARAKLAKQDAGV